MGRKKKETVQTTMLSDIEEFKNQIFTQSQLTKLKNGSVKIIVDTYKDEYKIIVGDEEQVTTKENCDKCKRYLEMNDNFFKSNMFKYQITFVNLFIDPFSDDRQEYHKLIN